MILTKEQLSEITDEEGVYDCNLISRQFAYRFFKTEVSPLGNMLSFTAPMRLGPLNIEEGLVLAAELPNTNMFGAVCFQRLYTTQIGSLLSVLTEKEFYVQDSCLFRENEQISISILNKVKDSVVFQIIFPIIIYNNLDRFGRLELEQQTATFVQHSIAAFNQLTQSIFVETRRDNF